MKRLRKGFTIIELMIVIAIIAVLIAIAYPAYMDYSVRAKVSELVVEAGSFRTRVTDKAVSQAALPGSGIGLTVTPSGKVTGGSVGDDGTVTIMGSPATVGADVTVILTPAMSGGIVVWSCSAGTLETRKFMPPECRN